MAETETEMAASPQGYAHPEVLVDTAWVEAHLDDPFGADHRGRRRPAAV